MELCVSIFTNIQEFSLADLKELPLEVQDLWFEESETIDLWMMFDKKPLKVQVLHRKEETLSDETGNSSL